jgi:hypothetical protein
MRYRRYVDLIVNEDSRGIPHAIASSRSSQFMEAPAASSWMK